MGPFVTLLMGCQVLISLACALWRDCVYFAINPFTAMLAPPSFGKRPIKMPNLKALKIFFALHEHVKGLYKKHSIKSGFVIGPSNILFAGAYVCTFQPRNVTDWGSEGVNILLIRVNLRLFECLLMVTHYRLYQKEIKIE